MYCMFLDLSCFETPFLGFFSLLRIVLSSARMPNICTDWRTLAHLVLLCVVVYGADGAISFLQALSWPQSIGIRVFFIFCDSATHAIISAIVWSAVVVDLQRMTSSASFGVPIHFILCHLRNHFTSIISALIAGSLLDVDHFLAAQSLTLYGATHLNSRPFGHALVMAIVLSAVVYLLSKQEDYSLLTFTAVVSHQLRDALRRGLWLWPFEHTPPLSRGFAILCLMSLIGCSRLIRDCYQRTTHEEDSTHHSSPSSALSKLDNNATHMV